MEQVFFVLALVGLLGCTTLMFRHQQRKKQMDRMTEQIEHFLLYPQDPLEESLSEGGVTNLYNQLSRLEQQLLLQQETAMRQERQTTRFVENMAHQMKNALTALQIQLDILDLSAPDEAQEVLQKSQACMDRLTDEIDKLLKSSQLAERKIRMAFEPVDLREEITACRERLIHIANMQNVTIKIEGSETFPLPADSFWLSQALAKDIIAAHHGTISARNREERGAVFDIVLPVLDGVKPYTLSETSNND